MRKTRVITDYEGQDFKPVNTKISALDSKASQDIPTRCGFIAVIGRPNAGKSTLLNALANQKLALTSHKANATRKQMQFIIHHNGEDKRGRYRAQLVFVDTPGIHRREKLLNQYMLGETLRAMSDCELGVVLIPITDEVSSYLEFLESARGSTLEKRHIVVLSKVDKLTYIKMLEKIAQYNEFRDKFLALIPISSYKNAQDLLGVVSAYVADSVFLYDEESVTTTMVRDIIKEFIREAVFDNVSAEIPYESDVVIKKFKEGEHINTIHASIITHKNSQKIILVGKNGATIKRIGICARAKIEEFLEQQVFLKLHVEVNSRWSKEVGALKKMGYNAGF